jgi:hypothetical protein
VSRKRDFTQDPEVQKKLRDLDKLVEQQRRVDIRWLMGHEAGRRFVYDLVFERCELQSVYPGQDSGIYRAEGRREVGLKLAAEIQRHHPEQYVRMIQEQVEWRDNFKKLREAALTPSHDDEPEST